MTGVQIDIPCPRCHHKNSFARQDVVGPLGIFCRHCGSAFDRVALATIRHSLRQGHGSSMWKTQILQTNTPPSRG